MPKTRYKTLVNQGVAAINAIPADEIKYYLLLTLKAISKEDSEKNRLMLAELVKLSKVLSASFKPGNSPLNYVENIKRHYQKLADLSETDTLSVTLGYGLLDLGSVLTAFIAGLLGAVTGSLAGLVRAACTSNNPLPFLADGFITGIALGGAIGFRTPKKLLKNELTRQLRFALNGVDDCLEKMIDETNKSYSYFEAVVAREILQTNFNNDREAFQAFLKRDVSYEIATVAAQFISKDLEGYLGHHSRIIINLPNQEKETLIEFTPASNKIDERPLTQVEKRRVSGQKIIEMMACHRHLWQTEKCDPAYILTKLKGGDNDCFSYVNKVLIATNQDATTCRRFDGKENWVGHNIVGFFMQGLSPFSQKVFANPEVGCSI